MAPLFIWSTKNSDHEFKLSLKRYIERHKKEKNISNKRDKKKERDREREKKCFTSFFK